MGEKDPRIIFKAFIDTLAARLPLHAVILFGSRARGTSGPWSDYDIIVIADFTGRFVSRGKWVVQLAPDVPVDIFCYTPGEFERMFSSFNLTAIDAIGEGVVLHGEAFVEPYKRRHEMLLDRGLKKTAHVLEPPGQAC